MSNDKLQAGPRIGDEVLFKEFYGCTISKVFDDGSVEVHIPYFGCEIAGPEEWQPKHQTPSELDSRTMQWDIDEAEIPAERSEQREGRPKAHAATPGAKKMSAAQMRELASGGDDGPAEKQMMDRQKSRDDVDKAMQAILAEHEVDVDDSDFANTWLSHKQRRLKRNHEVWLHVYDLDSVTAKINDWGARALGMGAFHCGVEVLGDEWFFVWGESSASSTTGVLYSEPKSHMVHVYKESVSLGETPLTEDEVRNIIADAMDAWPADTYHIVNRNCVHFAEDLSKRLRVPEKFPAWVRGAPDAGQHPLIQPIADYGWRWLKSSAETPEPAPEQSFTLGNCFCAPGRR